jgi:hypothetical protein
MSSLKEKLQQEVLDSIDLTSDITDDELLNVIDEILVASGRRNYISIQEKGDYAKKFSTPYAGLTFFRICLMIRLLLKLW